MRRVIKIWILAVVKLSKRRTEVFVRQVAGGAEGGGYDYG